MTEKEFLKLKDGDIIVFGERIGIIRDPEKQQFHCCIYLGIPEEDSDDIWFDGYGEFLEEYNDFEDIRKATYLEECWLNRILSEYGYEWDKKEKCIMQNIPVIPRKLAEDLYNYIKDNYSDKPIPNIHTEDLRVYYKRGFDYYFGSYLK